MKSKAFFFSLGAIWTGAKESKRKGEPGDGEGRRLRPTDPAHYLSIYDLLRALGPHSEAGESEGPLGMEPTVSKAKAEGPLETSAGGCSDCACNVIS